MNIEQLAADTSKPYKTTQAMVADGLRKGILNGTLGSGRILRQEEIASEFGVSRIPVREALRQLDGEDLVTITPHRGAVVTMISPDEALEITEIRIVLETAAISKAIPNMDEGALQKAKKILNLIDREEYLDVHRWAELNLAFHTSLYEPGEQPRMLALVESQHKVFERYICLQLDFMEYREKGQREHRQLLELCRRKNAEAAVRLTTQHVFDVGKMVVDSWRKRTGA